jgi:hypothetical protein
LAAYYFNLQQKSEGLDCLKEALNIDESATDEFFDFYEEIYYNEEVSQLLLKS